MTPAQIQELENRTWKRPAPYSDEWFAEAEEFHGRRAHHFEQMKKRGLHDKNGRFLFQDDIDAETIVTQQAKDRTLLSVIAQLRVHIYPASNF